MDFSLIELPNQTIYLNKWGIIKISVAIPIPELKSDVVIVNGDSWKMDKWYLNKNTWFGGIGTENKRTWKTCNLA